MRGKLLKMLVDLNTVTMNGIPSATAVITIVLAPMEDMEP